MKLRYRMGISSIEISPARGSSPPGVCSFNEAACCYDTPSIGDGGSHVSSRGGQRCGLRAHFLKGYIRSTGLANERSLDRNGGHGAGPFVWRGSEGGRAFARPTNCIRRSQPCVFCDRAAISVGALSPQGRGLGLGGSHLSRDRNPSPHPSPYGRGSRPSLPLDHRTNANTRTDHAALRLARKSPMRSSALRMFSVELA